MKKHYLILICISLLLISACAGNPNYIRENGYTPNENHLEFIISHNKTKNEAYSIAENWIAKNYNSANDVIQQKDKENGVIVVKALAPWATAYAYYTLEVRVKDNKSKLSFNLGGCRWVDGTERLDCAPPVNYMPELITHLKNIKDKLSTEWNKETSQDNF